ncbi:MAG: carboxymuconolactone decarboxylase family protein [Ilumatobacteraceae bacterium]
MPARIAPLLGDDQTPEVKELLGQVLDGGPVVNLFATLVRHPKIFRRWIAFGGALLYRGELSLRDRELLVLRTAWNTQSDYDWGHHARIAREAGLSEDEIEALIVGPDGAGWSEHESAVLRAADELHHDSGISESTWTTLAATYDERQLIEVCMLVGQYHIVCYSLNSLQIEREPGVPGLPR